MATSGRILEWYRRTRDRIKGRIKSLTRCNWPELTKYCGCCSLSTGIYIRSVVMIIITLIEIGLNGSVLGFLLNIDKAINDADLTEFEDFWDPDADWATLYLMYRAILIHYIFWISFKCLYMLIVMWTIYAVYKKNAKMIKILVYISIPNVIMDFFVSMADSILLNYGLKLFLLIFVLSETYNILAMNSQYKQLRGKSRVVVECTSELDSNTEQIYPNHLETGSLRFRPRYSQAHCQSCTCNNVMEDPPEYTNNRDAEMPTQSTIEPAASYINPGCSTNPNSSNAIITRNVDIAEENVANIQINEAGNNTNGHTVTSNTPNLRNNVKEVKVDLSDHPVIYDERQLNVGTSPVLADR